MDTKTKNRLISAARKVSRWWGPRVAVKKALKVDKALYECSKCGKYCYEGKSARSFQDYVEKYPGKEVSMEYLDIDHIQTAVPLSGWDSWDGFYERLFCDETGLRGLCSTKCHKEKTGKERKVRLANKYGKK